MEITLNNLQKKAIMKVCIGIADMDGVAHPEELNFIKSLLGAFEFSNDEFNESHKMDIEDAADVIEAFDADQKAALVAILTHLIEVDGEVHEKELELLGAIANRCNIDLPFNKE